MAQLERINVKAVDGDPVEDYLFFCPGCRCGHRIRVKGPKAWTWNGSIEKPTFSPSYLTWCDGEPSVRCHSYIREGRIEFLADCTHELKGQTVDLQNFPEVANGTIKGD